MKESLPEHSSQAYAVGILCVTEGTIVAVAAQGLSLDRARRLQERVRELQPVILPPGHRANPLARWPPDV